MTRNWALAVVVVVAYLLRLVPVIIHPSLDWGDEVFQTTEQAHRLIYGSGLIPWEFQVGMRSWLLPGAIAVVMAAARALGPGPAIYLPAIAGTLGLLALAPAVCAFLWCRRALGGGPALLAALVVAVAPELVYFGDRALAEVVAAHLLVLALYALLPGIEVRSARRLAVGGALLGLTLLLRLQLLPAVALVALFAARRVRVGPIAAGLAVVLCCGGALDAMTLGSPFASIWRYIDYNIFKHASEQFGVQPWYYYGAAELAIWGAAILVPIALCICGLRVGYVPVAVAALIVVTHSCLGHKEHRFIYPALMLLAVQAGFGLAWVASRIADRRLPGLPRDVVAAAAGLSWCLIALLVWNGPAMRTLRNRVHDELRAAAFSARAPAVCGIGMYGPGPDAWVPYGGYTHLHQNVPLFWPADATGFAAYAPSFNLLLTPATPPIAGFSRQACFGTVCVFRRRGECVPHAPMNMPFPPGIAAIPIRREID